jgi:AraC-like DNA-binding protein
VPDVVVPWWDFPRSPSAVNAFIETGAAHGLSAAECLEGSGLSVQSLAAPDALVGADQELIVARNLLQSTNDLAGIGADAGSRFTLGSTSVLGFAMLASATFRRSLRVGIENVALSSLFNRPVLVEESHQARIILDSSETPSDAKALLLERDLSALASVLPLVMGNSTYNTGIVVKVSLDADRRSHLARLHPDMTVVAASTSEFVVAQELLDLPLPSADPATAEICARRCRETLAYRRQRDSSSSTVRAILLRDPARMPSIQAIAGQMHIDVRTLRRRLTRERTTFRIIEAQIRESLATELLATSAVTIDEIAHRLGYSEGAAFSRAYKKWTGVAPNAARRHRPARTGSSR